MKGSLFEYFELYGITIIGLIGRDFLKDRILEFNGITGTVTITTNTE